MIVGPLEEEGLSHHSHRVDCSSLMIVDHFVESQKLSEHLYFLVRSLGVGWLRVLVKSLISGTSISVCFVLFAP